MVALRRKWWIWWKLIMPNKTSFILLKKKHSRNVWPKTISKSRDVTFHMIQRSYKSTSELTSKPTTCEWRLRKTDNGNFSKKQHFFSKMNYKNSAYKPRVQKFLLQKFWRKYLCVCLSTILLRFSWYKCLESSATV